MPAIPTSTGIVLFPALINWLLASLPVTLFAAGFYIWRHALHESSPLVLAALIGLDHLIAFMIARPLLVHFLAANFSSSRATSGDLATDASIHAVRATSAVGIALAVDTILVQLLDVRAVARVEVGVEDQPAALDLLEPRWRHVHTHTHTSKPTGERVVLRRASNVDRLIHGTPPLELD